MFWRKKEAKAMISTVGEAELQGTQLHVNPTPEMSLARCEGRLKRVKQFLASEKCIRGTTKELAHQTIKRRLKIQIKLLKGDY